MELLALGKPIKKPPRSDERDGELFCGTSILPVNRGIIINGSSGTQPIDISNGSYQVTAASGSQYAACIMNVSAWSKVKTNIDALYACKGFNDIDSMTPLNISYNSFTNISAYDYIAFWSVAQTLTFQ